MLFKRKGIKKENPEVRWGTETFRGLSTSYGIFNVFLSSYTMQVTNSYNFIESLDNFLLKIYLPL